MWTAQLAVPDREEDPLTNGNKQLIVNNEILSYFAYADANYQKLIANYHKLYVKSKKIIFEKFTSIFCNYTLSEAPNELGVRRQELGVEMPQALIIQLNFRK